MKDSATGTVERDAPVADSPQRVPVEDRPRVALKFIRDYTTKHGFPPSRQELADRLGIKSNNGLARLELYLVRSGQLRPRRTGQHRAYVPVDTQDGAA